MKCEVHSPLDYILLFFTLFVKECTIMLNKIMYWLGALATFFPLCILPIPFWLSFIIIFAIYFLMMFLPPVSTIVEIIFWVWGIIQLTNMPFSFLTVIGILLFIFWILSTVSFYYGFYQSKKF